MKKSKRIYSMHPQYWYYISIIACFRCGKIDTTKERRYTKKPIKNSERYNREHNVCNVCSEYYY